MHVSWLAVGCALGGCAHPAASPDASPPADAASCACTFGDAVRAGEIAAAGTGELSGLAVSRAIDDLVWAEDDSGAGPYLYGYHFDGSARGILELSGATNVDWEDLAIAACTGGWCLYVGDTGDNDLSRAAISVYRAVEPAASADGLAVSTIAADRFDIAYPDGAHDAESLFVDPRDGSVYTITKVSGASGTVYQLPLSAGTTTTAVAIGTVSVPIGETRITAADLYIDECGARLLVRTDAHVFERRAAADVTIAQLIAATAAEVPVAVEAQGEAVGWLPGGRAYATISEGSSSPIDVVSCATQ